MKKIGLFIMCCIALVVFSNSNNSCCSSNAVYATDLPQTASASAYADVPEAASATAAISLPKIIDFGSKKCVACKAMEPVLESCKEKHADKFITEFVDVWIPDNQMFARAHNISSIPTQVFLGPDGKEVYRNVGFISEEDILAKWTELGFISGDAPTESTPATANASETSADEPTAGTATTSGE